VALGPNALQSAIDVELATPLLSLFTSNETFERMLSAIPPRRRSQITAIFAEASPAHQLRLVRTLWARRVSVGVLLSASTSHMEPALRRAARNSDLRIDIEVVRPDDNPVMSLSKLRDNTVVLSIPDREVYTAVNLRTILEATYRRNQPIIGFSAALVNAGALAAAYSTIDDVIVHAGDVLAELGEGRTVEPQYPKYWRVAVNESVAASMNVVVADNVRTLGNQAP
jgi:ABC-type uncharacterized transport system substrate-binding protein